MIIFILGGLKSGKTSFALNYSREDYFLPGVYIATAQPFDEEMEIKIKNHHEERK